MSKAGSHPRGEDKIRRTDSAHSFGCIAVYFDVVDYSPEADFFHGARYDLVGYDVSTAAIIVAPMKQKNTPAIQQAVSSRLGPGEEFAWTRSDGAPKIGNAPEVCGGKHFPYPPHLQNANLIERIILTFGDLQRMTFAQSGCAPYWRPIVAISAAQQWSIHRQTGRRDIGKEIVRTPMHWRHSDKYQPFSRHNALLCVQLVTVVPPKLETEALGKPEARGEQ